MAYPLPKLSFSNDYVFKEVMTRSKTVCKGVLERILDVRIEHIEYKEAEREFRPALGSHAIRLDVYLADEKGTVYDVELQKANHAGMAKRLRYYQSAIDAECLKRGDRYRDLPTSYVIMICTDYDIMGAGYSFYHFQQRCQYPDLAPLDDGSHLIVCNAMGDKGAVSKDFSALMRYLGGDDASADDEFVREIDEAISSLAEDDAWRTGYMKYECDIDDAWYDGKQEGLKEGIEQGIEQGRNDSVLGSVKALMGNLGFSAQQALDALGIPKAEQGAFLSML